MPMRIQTTKKTGFDLRRSLVAFAWLAVAGPVALGQTPVDPQELAEIRQAYYEQLRETGPSPQMGVATVWGQAQVADAQLQAGGQRQGRSTDLYNGLPAGASYWFYSPGTYWALDDGTMGSAAVAVGGGEVTAYEFAFGLHADSDGDTLQPVVFINLWNAPLDPIGDASDPVVDPLAPVSSVAVTFSPITLPTAGDYVLTSGLLELATAGLEFNLDETFYVEIVPLKLHAGYPVPDPNVFAVFSVGPILLGTNQDNMWSDLWVRDGVGGYIP